MNIPIGNVTGELVLHGWAGARGHDRLDGWKRIAAHFARDRSTVIRWTRERGLPVHRLPGGRTGTVYAFRHELDRWAGLPCFTESACAPPTDRTLLTRSAMPVGALALPAAANGQNAAPPALPGDPDTANRFLTARDLIAERETEGLERAIAMLGQVTRAMPRFAPAYAALGEALVLSCEFGKRRNATTFPLARQVARTAIRLDPALVAGHRLLGFIAYWADGDFAEAQEAFERALAIDVNDGMTHFWYGNVLADHGQHATALEALGRARLMQPGSVAIRTDLAWAQWAMGHEITAIASLSEIADRYPNFATAHKYLAMIAFIGGDCEGHVRHFSALALARGEPRLAGRAKELKDAMSVNHGVMHEAMLRHAMADLSKDARSSVWATTITSLAGDRDATLALLQDATRRGERWEEAGLVRRIRRLWHHDQGILRQISALKFAAAPTHQAPNLVARSMT